MIPLYYAPRIPPTSELLEPPEPGAQRLWDGNTDVDAYEDMQQPGRSRTDLDYSEGDWLWLTCKCQHPGSMIGLQGSCRSFGAMHHIVCPLPIDDCCLSACLTCMYPAACAATSVCKAIGKHQCRTPQL